MRTSGSLTFILKRWAPTMPQYVKNIDYSRPSACRLYIFSFQFTATPTTCTFIYPLYGVRLSLRGTLQSHERRLQCYVPSSIAWYLTMVVQKSHPCAGIHNPYEDGPFSVFPPKVWGYAAHIPFHQEMWRFRPLTSHSPQLL